ncbi:amino acid adenylation domain-containing protein [Rugamonas sp. FT82W]|uniref:Amino acid adenylation domain-containing protein n=1 Tax=Duganella vulcania TaxID=2692166 RepID=A0A845G201_9BURK|nr:non-ribosomal peptide synthetase [Duganella vulcania]MYM86939.1 amino acid adenylation domain-containing protein [Duganella vulcania]
MEVPAFQPLPTDFNDTIRPYPRDGLVHQVFEQVAAAAPDRTAIDCAGRTFSYGDVNRRANQLAHRLIALGVRPDQRIALVLDRSAELVIATLAVLKAGAAYLPLDPATPAERLSAILADAAPAAILCETAIACQPSTVVQLSLRREAEDIGRQPAHNPDAAALGLHARHLAYVMYTSGSTGMPKGVMIEHRNVLRLAVNAGFAPLTEADCVAHCANPAFDAATWEIWGALLNGARLLVIAPETLLRPRAFCQALVAGGATALWMTAGLFNEYADELEPAFSRLTWLLAGGDVLDARRVAQVLSKPGRPLHLLNGYGPTETTTFATTFAIDAAAAQAGAIPIGRPIGNTQIHILDEQGKPVALGVTGEIHIGGDGVGRGYLNRPELSAERFIADPFAGDPEARLYRSGDLGRWRADGVVEFVGRNDFQVKLRGFRIEPGEIEVRLAACGGVREALVLLREDSPGDKRLVGYLVGTGIDTQAVRARLKAELPAYMVPASLVVLERFPLTVNGKVDRKALPAPQREDAAAGGFEAPQGAHETALAAIWQDLLALRQVGRHDNFFELGGHSLMVLRLAARLRRDLGIELSPRALFEQASLAGMASLVAGAGQASWTPMTAGAHDGAAPLSHAQQRLWFLNQLDPAAGLAYHMPVCYRLDGPLDEEALKAALARIVARHDILRTSFVAADGVPVQRVAGPGQAAPLLERDLSYLPPEDQAAARGALYAAEIARPFDLAAGPLFRALLLRLAPETHELLLIQHHIVSDGWSMGVIKQELAALYGAYRAGRADPLPPLPLQYADYAAWQRRPEQAAALQRQLAYWRGHLEGAPALLELPADRPRPERQSYRGSRAVFALDADATSALRELALRHNATLFMVLLAGWSCLLSRMSGQFDIVVGTPVANRPRPELETMVGFFANTLALRVRLDGNPTAAQVLAGVRDVTLSAYENQELPFDHLVEAINPPRSMAYGPLFQTVVALDNTAREHGAALAGLSLEQASLPQSTTHFDLSLLVADDGAGIAGHLEYSSDLFNHASVQQMGDCLKSVLAAMAADDSQALSRLPLLSAPARDKLLKAFNPPPSAYPRDALVHQLFERVAAATPGATAIEHAGQRVAYGDLNRRANQLAHELLARGLQPEDRVALVFERSPLLIVAMLAVLKAGGAYVPLETDTPRPRIAQILGDSAARLVLCAQPLDELGAGWPQLALADAGLAARVSARPAHSPGAMGLHARNLAYVMYTSGSTGAPKGVMIEHRNIVRLVVDSGYAPLAARDRVAHCANPAFDAATWEIWGALLNGAGVVVIDNATVLRPQAFNRALLDGGVTALWLTVGLFNQYAEDLEPAFANLDCLLVGGDVLDARRIADALGKAKRPKRLLNGYGPTETTTFATTFEIGTAASKTRSIPIGKPIANTTVYILDQEGQPVPPGVTGEIWIGGDGVARGYLNRPEQTAERFVRDPFDTDPEARLYRSGDLGRWRADGNIEFMGRGDAQVKLRGFRIEPGEIEARLAACAGVREALVLLREDSPGDKRLVAYLTAVPGAVLDTGAIRDQLKAVLPAYMLPAALMPLDRLPLTPNGKVDRRALPRPDTAPSRNDTSTPLTDEEAALAGHWRELLHQPHINAEDSFFDLGGHSLLAIRLVARIEQQHGIEFPLGAVFEAPQLRQMATRIAIERADCNPEVLHQLLQQLDNLSDAQASAQLHRAASQ